MAGLGSLFIDLLARTGKFETDIGRAARVAERESKKIQKEFGDKLQKQFDDLGRKAKAAVVGYLGVQTLQSIVRISDQYTQLRGRLALVTEGTEELGQVHQALFGIAQRTRTEMSGVADLYIKLAQTGRELGASQQELLQFTEAVGNALTVSGSNAQQASGALLQLSQALAGGTVRAEEFNSIVEGAPEILRTVATNMDGMGGSIGKLRQAVIKGQVSSQEFFQAFLKGSSSLAERAQSMPVTVGQAFIRMQNNINQAIGGTNMSPLVDSINELSETISDPTFQHNLSSLLGLIASISGVVVKAGAAVGNFVKLFSDLGSLIDSKVFGDELPIDLKVRLSEPSDNDIAELEQALATAMRRRSNKKLVFFGKDGIVKWYSDQELDEEIAVLTKKLEAARAKSAPNSTEPSGLPEPPPPSEEFLKLSAKLEEQIALYGKVGLAAQISYQIQSGALDELSEREQQQVLALARRYDAVVATAEAEKKAMERRKQAEEEWQQLLERGASIAESVRTPYENYKETLQELNDALSLGVITLETYTRALVKAQEEYVNTANAVSEFASQNNESLNQGLESFEADFEARFLKGLETLTVFQEQAARNTQDIIADTLVSGFDEGVDGVLKSFGEMLKKLIAQAVAADIAKRLFGAAGGGTGGGWIGMAAGWLGRAFGGGRAIGGPVLAGTTYRINEREPEFFRPRVGGDIIPLSKMPNMGGGMSLTQNFSVRAETGERVSRRTEQQIAAAASRGLAMASRRNN